MVLVAAPRNVLLSAPVLRVLGTLVLIYGPCFFIAYGWVRGRKWGRYLLIAYNGIWFKEMSYSFFVWMANYSESHLDLVVTVFLSTLVLLGCLTGLAFQKDIRASMVH